MWLDLIDALRCPNDHEETALVCVAHRSRDRDLEEGDLGCASCRATFAVREGVAWFGGTSPPDVAGVADEGQALRVTALLDLRTPGGIVVFSAGAASCAAVVAGQAEVHALAVNVAAARPGLVSAFCGVRTLPLAAGSLRGGVLDDSAAAMLESTARAVRTGGRLIAPASWEVPADYRELARDEREWVAEHESARSRPVMLRVAR